MFIKYLTTIIIISTPTHTHHTYINVNIKSNDRTQSEHIVTTHKCQAPRKLVEMYNTF